MTLPARIEQKIVRVPFSGCWVWMGSGERYGYVHLNGQVVRAHRAVFELSGGHVPPDRELMHSCDVGVCVNPYHLRIGTHVENMADMVRKGRSRAPVGDEHWTRQHRERAAVVGRRNIRGTHHAGAQNNNAKADDAVVAQIRAAYVAEPNLSMTALGQRFGLGREQTRKIVKGIVWKS